MKPGHDQYVYRHPNGYSTIPNPLLLKYSCLLRLLLKKFLIDLYSRSSEKNKKKKDCV